MVMIMDTVHVNKIIKVKLLNLIAFVLRDTILRILNVKPVISVV